MRAWRIHDPEAPRARQPNVDPLSGAGGLHAAARWNHKGHPILYASSNPSLALLEVLVHVDPSRFGERTLVELSLDDDVEEVTHAHLLQIQREATGDDLEAGIRRYGAYWLQEKRTLALRAPSFVTPLDSNVMVKPLHPRARSLRIVRNETVVLDARLFPGERRSRA